ncbi:MAG: hypothetical protein F6K32_15165 [Desertifilum sp. SIO1I2]|nr:hypothetical protein [Desertifilum sp. SIO1I2]
MKVVRTTTGKSNQNSLRSEADFEDDLKAELAEDEGNNPLEVIKASESQNQASSNLFNVTQEQVENPQYWIDL